MTFQAQDTVTFRMRFGKKLEYTFGGLWFLFLFAFSVWLTIQGTNRGKWSTPFIVFMIFFCVLPLCGALIFIIGLIRTKLIFSKDDIFYQGPFSSKKVSWEEITGFYNYSYDTFLNIEKPFEKRKVPNGIPISWFSKIHRDNKPYKPDNVMRDLMTFAPHLFDAKPSE